MKNVYGMNNIVKPFLMYVNSLHEHCMGKVFANNIMQIMCKNNSGTIPGSCPDIRTVAVLVTVISSDEVNVAVVMVLTIKLKQPKDNKNRQTGAY